MQGCETHGLADATELPSMLATLCSYEGLFGSCHPITLRLLTEVGIAFWRLGRTDDALIILQRGLRDITRTLGRNHDLRLRALATLRDIFTEIDDYAKAAALQKELLECHAEIFGAGHAETSAARE